jgi:hypothetical protein
MIFGYFTLFVALFISAVAAYYSIVGLTAIFSAAVIPIVIMGASLEVGKVTAAIWLKLNWHRANLTYKLYLVPALIFLMFLTSMGIFGFLSQAHSDQSLVSGDVQAKISVYDEKIRTAKDNIDANRKALKQMDEAVDQVMGRSADEKGADKAVSIRRSQARERARLLSEITAEQKTIATVNEARAPIAAEVRKVEAEVGPIKYIAAFVYGDNPETNILERAVRWVIILIVAVFDPLALVLILAAQQSIKWAREDKQETDEDAHKRIDQELAETKQDIDTTLAPKYEPDDGPLTDSQVEQIKTTVAEKYPYLNQPFVHFKDLKPMVAAPPKPEVVSEPEPEPEPVVVSEPPTQVITAEESAQLETVAWPQEPVTVSAPATAKRYKAPITPVPETRNVRKEMQLVADNVAGTQARSDFGLKFPDSADKGDMFLRVDYLPNKLFKFNGIKWIEVDKSKTDSYTYDEQYILFLIEKLKTGEYDIDQLSASEQELVADKLNQLNNEQT